MRRMIVMSVAVAAAALGGRAIAAQDAHVEWAKSFAAAKEEARLRNCAIFVSVHQDH